MATRSLIGIRNTDNTITYSYCHWDGYPAHNGAILLNSYQTADRVRELMALGDLSSLGHDISTNKPHTWDKPVTGVCVAYGRDRGGTGTECKTVSDEKEYIEAGNGHGAEHLYLFDINTNKWTIDTNHGVFIELTQAICKE